MADRLTPSVTRTVTGTRPSTRLVSIWKLAEQAPLPQPVERVCGVPLLKVTWIVLTPEFWAPPAPVSLALTVSGNEPPESWASGRTDPLSVKVGAVRSICSYHASVM